MAWGKPWNVEPASQPTTNRPGPNGSAVAIVCAVAHVAATGAWLLLRAPSPPPTAPRAPALAVGDATVEVLATARCPALEAEPLVPASPRPRFTGLALNPTRPDVVLAWSTTEVAFSADDGRSLVVSTLPDPPDDAPAPVAAVTPSGAALVMRTERPWWRSVDGVRSEVVPPPFRDEVRLATADGSRVLVMTVSEDGADHYRVSTDDGRTWTEGPTPPREVYALSIRRDGTVEAAYAWSESCGEGDEGFATLGKSGTEWTVESRGPIARRGADGWLYDEGYAFGGPQRMLRAWHERHRVTLGPPVPATADTWFATDGRSTYLGIGEWIVAAEQGAFARLDVEVPPTLHAGQIDGRGRIVGLTASGIARGGDGGAFSELPIPSGSPPVPAPPR